MDFLTARKFFPVTEKYVYLNNAAESPLNKRVNQRLEEYLKLASEEPHKKPPVREIVRDKLSTIFGGSPKDYALITSTGLGVGIVASGFCWEKGDNVVLPIDEHRNNTFPWLALEQKGVEIRLVPVDENQRVNPENVASMVDGRTKIVATAAVRYNTGFRTDLRKMSEIAHSNGALLLVDGIQGAGVYPIDVISDGIDILCCAGFKWLLGAPGTGFMYVNKEVQEKINPVLPGMYAAENHARELHYLQDARRYETGTIAYSLFYSWLAGLEILEEVGIKNIHSRVLQLTDRIISGLQKKNIEIVSPIEKIEERSAILSISVGSESDNENCCNRLKENNILVASRDGRIRVSPNFFINEEEIDRFLEII